MPFNAMEDVAETLDVFVTAMVTDVVLELVDDTEGDRVTELHADAVFVEDVLAEGVYVTLPEAVGEDVPDAVPVELTVPHVVTL